MSRINHYDPDAASAGGVPWASWRDTDGDVWQIEYGPDRVVLHRGEEVVELPRSSWSRDILVAQYDDEVVVRIETFDRAIGFHVPLQTAKPLMDFLSAGGAMPTPQVAPAYEEEADRPLLWPKVSPLAVYAVICAAVSFIPWIGILPALVSLGLLIQHHQTVRKTRAWSHSRALCTLASVLLVLGVSVSILAIITPRVVSAARHAGGGHGQPVLRMGSEVGSDALAQANVEAGGLLDGSILAQSRFDGVDWGLVAAGLIVVLFSLTIHEAGHAISAWWLGDDLAKRMGRVTLSPMAHIDPIGTVILPILLWSQLGMFFGWAKPVPVMLDHLENRRRAHSLVSLAGAWFESVDRGGFDDVVDGHWLHRPVDRSQRDHHGLRNPVWHVRGIGLLAGAGVWSACDRAFAELLHQHHSRLF